MLSVRAWDLIHKYENPQIRHNTLTVEDIKPLLYLVGKLAGLLEAQVDEIRELKHQPEAEGEGGENG